MVEKIVDGLKEHEAVEVLGDFDEGALLEKRIASMDRVPETMVMGSSHVLYVAWDFRDFVNIGMSGEFLDDYYATIGLLEKYDKIPQKLVMSVDPYIFMDELSIRQETLTEYAAMEKENISEASKKKAFRTGNPFFSKCKELFSFSYFQSSVEMIVKGRNASYVNPTDDTSEGDYAKILKTGRRVPTPGGYMSTQEMDWASEWDVSNGAIFCMVDYPKLSEAKMHEFEALVDHIRSLGIDVSFYLSSWYPVYYDEFKVNPKFGAVIKAEDFIRETAALRGITVHGSFDPYECGIQKEDFLDHFHLKPDKAFENYMYVR